MSHHEPTVLERLAAAGLKPELLAELRDRHQRRTPCQCTRCQQGLTPETPSAVDPDSVEGRFLFPEGDPQ